MSEVQPNILTSEDSIDAIYELFYSKGCTDGLPIIPPTKERVAKMMATVDRPPSETVGILPPRNAPATIQLLAINAVMAGCLPSYFPVIVAATEAMADPAFNLLSISTTTNPTSPMLIINGPVRHQIDLNCGWNIMGPGWRANSTIGRAISLIMLNIGGRIPGEGTKSVLGWSGRYGMCIGEREEESPWEPLHVERGFKPEDSVVTVTSPTGFHALEDFTSHTAEQLLTNLSGGMHFSLALNCYPYWAQAEYPMLMCSGHASILSGEGLSKKDVQQQLFERTLDVPLSFFSEEHLEEMRAMDREEVGIHVHGNRGELIKRNLVKPGQTQITEKGAAMAARPDQFMIVVAGGDAGYHSALLPPFGDSFAVSRRIML